MRWRKTGPQEYTSGDYTITFYEGLWYCSYKNGSAFDAATTLREAKRLCAGGNHGVRV